MFTLWTFPHASEAGKGGRNLSVVAPADKRLWVPVVAGVVALAAITMAAIVVTSERAGAPTRAASRAEGTVPVAEGAAHANWSIRSYPAGIETKRTKADRARVDAARPRVRALVKDLYNAFFLHPDRLAQALSQHTTAAAARRIKRSGVGFPTGTVEATIKKRTARIGIQGNRAGHAVAAVRVVSKVVTEKRRFRLVHDGTLWLQREKGRWKVIGYAFDQRRAR